MYAIKEIKSSLANLKISYSDFNFLFKTYGEQLIQNLIIICLGDETEANEIFQKLDNEKKTIYELQTKLNDLLNFYKYFYPKSKIKNINNITDFQLKITNIDICDFQSFSISGKIKSFSSEIRGMSRFFGLYDSIFFMSLYREFKKKIKENEKDSKMIEETLLI